MPSNTTEDPPVPCVCRRGPEHPIKFGDIKAAATRTRPCRLCTIISKALEAAVEYGLERVVQNFEDPGRRSQILEAVSVNVHYTGLPKPKFRLKTVGPPVQPLEQSEIEIFQNSGHTVQPTFDGHVFPSDFPFGHQAFDSEFHKVRMWLRECLESHRCEELGSERFLKFPKRLLDIGSGENIRLLETKGSEKPYVTLSHRWGDAGSRRLMSTVTTIQAHREIIPWDSFPKTFQHAITICQGLDIRYLWIDTLCILQQHSTLTDTQRKETELDFAQENSAMADIYEGSYFTISADLATSMDSGMFTSYLLPGCVPVEVADDHGKTATLYARAPMIPHGILAEQVDGRGWILQEHILPPRLLHFGTYDITWRCRELHTCECEYICKPDKVHYSFRERLGKIAKELPRRDQRGLDFVSWWVTVVASYSHRKLSDPRDKLPALSGLAQIYSKATMETYLAGLWRGSLLTGLCWYIADCVEAHESILFAAGQSPSDFGVYSSTHAVAYRPKIIRAPSWSWASVDLFGSATECRTWLGPVGKAWNVPEPRRTICVLHDVYCMPKTSDPTGEVSQDCRLEIGVDLISTKIKKLSEAVPQWTIDDVPKGTRVKHCTPDCKMDDDGLSDGDQVFCAPILESLSDRLSERGCIMLKRLQDQTYRRVGFCIITKENPNHIGEGGASVGQESLLPLNDEDIKTREYAFQFDVDMLQKIVII